jgi:hypothetical protein
MGSAGALVFNIRLGQDTKNLIQLIIGHSSGAEEGKRSRFLRGLSVSKTRSSISASSNKEGQETDIP